MRRNSWETIDNVFYRRQQVYTMLWDVPNLSDYIIAVGKNGGPTGELTYFMHARCDGPR